MQPIKEPPPAAAGNTPDKKSRAVIDSKGKAFEEAPYAEDPDEEAERTVGSREGGKGMWGWLKGLGGADTEKSAHQVYKVRPRAVLGPWA